MVSANDKLKSICIYIYIYEPKKIKDVSGKFITSIIEDNFFIILSSIQ